MKTRSFTVIVYKEDDMYIAQCPEVGTVDQGETIEQAIAGLREATRLYIEFKLNLVINLDGCYNFLKINLSEAHCTLNFLSV